MNAVLVNQLNRSDVVTVGKTGFQMTFTNGMPKVYYPATSADLLAETMIGEWCVGVDVGGMGRMHYVRCAHVCFRCT